MATRASLATVELVAAHCVQSRLRVCGRVHGAVTFLLALPSYVDFCAAFLASSSSLSFFGDGGSSTSAGWAAMSGWEGAVRVPACIESAVSQPLDESEVHKGKQKV
jgi:hypothetical protein